MVTSACTVITDFLIYLLYQLVIFLRTELLLIHVSCMYNLVSGQWTLGWITELKPRMIKLPKKSKPKHPSLYTKMVCVPMFSEYN